MFTLSLHMNSFTLINFERENKTLASLDLVQGRQIPRAPKFLGYKFIILKMRIDSGSKNVSAREKNNNAAGYNLQCYITLR